MRPLKFVPPAKEAFVFMLLFASTVGALLSQVVGCIYGYLAYREVRKIFRKRGDATSLRVPVLSFGGIQMYRVYPFVMEHHDVYREEIL